MHPRVLFRALLPVLALVLMLAGCIMSARDEPSSAEVETVVEEVVEPEQVPTFTPTPVSTRQRPTPAPTATPTPLPLPTVILIMGSVVALPTSSVTVTGEVGQPARQTRHRAPYGRPSLRGQPAVVRQTARPNLNSHAYRTRHTVVKVLRLYEPGTGSAVQSCFPVRNPAPPLGRRCSK